MKTLFPAKPAAVPFVRLAVAGLGIAVLASCSTGPGAGDGATSHREGMSEIANVMRGFDEAVRKHVPGETDVHDRWEGVYVAIADASVRLEESAKQLMGHPPKGLELPDRGRFQVLARTLGERAAVLRAAAASNDPDAVSAARTDLAAACRDCHSRYRKDAPGIPDAFR